MTDILLLLGGLLIISVLSSRLLYKFGIPTLLIFISLGMLLGSDGPGGIYFANYDLAQNLSTLCLVFIMFYGGFGFNWKTGKPVASQSIFLATFGVVITALLVGSFASIIFEISLLEGMLLGAVISSTDAASVFSILRSKNLNLKGGLASMLEMESGSNDPMSYMLTIIVITLIKSSEPVSVAELLLNQIFFGLALGAAISIVSVYIFNTVKISIDGLYPIFTVGVVLAGYSATELLSGNGLLCVYVIGIIMGNSTLIHKRSLVHFFDGLSWLMQIILFFTLGLLVFPSQLPPVIFQGFWVSVFLVLVARPIAVFIVLSLFKVPIKQQLLVSWVGLRGAASIVFATYALTSNLPFASTVFNMVFFICLISILFQGTLIPFVAKKLDLVEENISVYKTFNDYQDEIYTKLIEYKIESNHPWAGKTVMEANIPEDILVVLIKRNKNVITPKGFTEILAGDIMVLSSNTFESLPM